MHKFLNYAFGILILLLAFRTLLTPILSRTETPVHTAARIDDQQPALPIRAAFYYPWFPDGWTQNNVYPFSNYTPSSGYYDSGDETVIHQHIAAMRYGGIDAGILSWWGPGHYTDTRIGPILMATANTEVRWAIYHEGEGQSDPTVNEITADLLYLRDHYGQDPAYLRLDGRFVVFVYADAKDACNMATRWTQANTSSINAYVVLKVFSGYQSCSNQPQNWHQYSPAKDADVQAGHSYTISPGFWKVGEIPRLERNLDRWRQNIRNMVASGAPFQLITTFNEWGEGSSVESAEEWRSVSGYGAYLDALHNDGADGFQNHLTLTLNSADSSSTPSTAHNSLADPVLVGAGDIAECDRQGDEATANLLDSIPGVVFTTGDNAYDFGSAEEFARCYDPSWGRHRLRTRPAPGNHEYLTDGAGPYYAYFGAAAGEPGKGYYSYDLGEWHIIVLNSNCSEVGGCEAGSAQEQWLRQDLAAHFTMCTLAYWHHPRFNSGKHGNHLSMDAFWRALYDYNADVVLNGHAHHYERFGPQDPTGRADPVHGIRQFIVGTGGKSHAPLEEIQPNSEIANDNAFGVLKLVLRPASYDWQFVPEAGQKFTDSGKGTCRENGAPSTDLPPLTASMVGTLTPAETARPSPTPTLIATASTFKFAPLVDAYVDEANPETNKGTSLRLRVDGSPTVRSYLRFNLQGIHGTIRRAMLRLYATSNSSTGFEVRRAAHIDWEELTLTYNNAPAPGGVVITSGPFSAGMWITVEITQLIDGNSSLSLVLTSTSTTALNLASRETGANAPQLIIEVSP